MKPNLPGDKHEPTRAELQAAILDSIDDVCVNHGALLNGTERTLVARFATYLELRLHEIPGARRYTLDMEYEVAGEARTKAFNVHGPGAPRTRKIVPDLIYHERGNAASNCLAIEVKIRETGLDEHDRAKLAIMTGAFPWAYEVRWAQRAAELPMAAETGPVQRGRTFLRLPDSPADPRPNDVRTVSLPETVPATVPYAHGAMVRFGGEDRIRWVNAAQR